MDNWIYFIPMSGVKIKSSYDPTKISLIFGLILHRSKCFLGDQPSSIWVLPKKIREPQKGCLIMENPIKMDDLGVPLFSQTSIIRRRQLLLQSSHPNDVQKWRPFQIAHELERWPGIHTLSGKETP